MRKSSNFKENEYGKSDFNLNIYGQLPPQATELETVILGALMIDANSIFIAMSKLFPEIFYVEANGKVFKAIQSLYDCNSKIDILTVVSQLKKTEELDLVGGMYYVMKLTNSVVSSANIESHIAIVSEMFLKREAIRLKLFPESAEILNQPD